MKLGDWCAAAENINLLHRRRFVFRDELHSDACSRAGLGTPDATITNRTMQTDVSDVPMSQRVRELGGRIGPHWYQVSVIM